MVGICKVNLFIMVGKVVLIVVFVFKDGWFLLLFFVSRMLLFVNWIDVLMFKVVVLVVFKYIDCLVLIGLILVLVEDLVFDFILCLFIFWFMGIEKVEVFIILLLVEG